MPSNDAQNAKAADDIASAIRLVIYAFEGRVSQNGAEPMASHSIRVGLQLSRFNDDTPVVLAGFFHDLLSETRTPASVIQASFGQEALDLVQACTVNKAITDRASVTTDLTTRICACGPKAVKIKIVCITDRIETILASSEPVPESLRNIASHWLRIGKNLVGPDSLHIRALNAAIRQAKH